MSVDKYITRQVFNIIQIFLFFYTVTGMYLLGSSLDAAGNKAGLVLLLCSGPLWFITTQYKHIGRPFGIESITVVLFIVNLYNLINLL